MSDLKVNLRIILVSGLVALALFLVAAFGLSNVGTSRLDNSSLKAANTSSQAQPEAKKKDKPCPPQSTYGKTKGKGNGNGNANGKKCGA